MNIAVIPARAGSKRIPSKNIRPFNGKPIIGYSIEAAKACECFERIIISTDDPEIAEIAVHFGGEVPFIRPNELADDFTGTNAVVAHTIHQLTENIDFACCIYATAPFIRPEVLRKGLQLLQANADFDYAVTVTSFPFPIQRALKLEENGSLQMREPEHRMTRSQDLDESYHDAGQIYWGHKEAFIEDRPLFSSNTLPIILSRYIVQDIDTEEDWLRAELMHKAIMELSL
ncbi:pseudaminic acid cytidylyltransferase [Dongshaea marina]|uniref:pseudaminic acid cytidylyltransferase n=1 Tax=Dongshaea marina TaxID=2047966 RepID=UPI000D3ECA6C|nr:pseudaminic acid cytidylyltransferase [Dongshaea marina]